MASALVPTPESGVDIYRYTDYRKYLADWRQAEKRRNSAISHEFLSRRLGVRSRAYFNDLEKGRRAIGPDLLDRLTKLLRLDIEQARYFRALVGYGQPASNSEREYWFEQLVALNHTPHRIVEQEVWEYFRGSHHTAVRALLDVFHCREDWEEGSRRLGGRISAEEFRRSIELLVRLGLVAKDDDGVYHQTEKILSTGDRAKGELLRRYQLGMLEELKGIIEADLPESYDSASLTLSLSEKGMQRVQTRLHQLRREIVSIAAKDEDPASHVYRVVLSLYGVTTGSRLTGS